MKTLMIATVAAITLSGAAFAGSTAQFAAEHFAASENGNGENRIPVLSSEAEVVSSKSKDLTAFAIEKLSNGPEDDR